MLRTEFRFPAAARVVLPRASADFMRARLLQQLVAAFALAARVEADDDATPRQATETDQDQIAGSVQNEHLVGSMVA